MLILIKRGTFHAVELGAVRRFCDERQFDLVYLPDLESHEVNRHNVYEGAPYYHGFARLALPQHRKALYREHAYDVRPPTDDKPYYHHFFRWRQVPEVWQALGHTWQPFGGGGYLILIAMLAVAVLASSALISLPLALGRSPGQVRPNAQGLTLVYFGSLGVAYLAVEIPLIQRLTLLVDHPTIAFVTVIAVLLTASGVGSLLAPRWRGRAIPVLVLYLLVLLLVLPAVSGVLLRCSLWVRVIAACAFLAPLGLLMGIPFPTGIALLRRSAPVLIPWAWGVNGCTSVITSIGTALIALQWGFNAVLGLAIAFYVLAWGILYRLASVEFAHGGKA
jgi:hypothetical protein